MRLLAARATHAQAKSPISPYRKYLQYASLNRALLFIFFRAARIAVFQLPCQAAARGFAKNNHRKASRYLKTGENIHFLYCGLRHGATSRFFHRKGSHDLLWRQLHAP
jgi:hypothetical protein